MEVSKLVRNPKRIKECLLVKGDMVIANENVRIMFPVRYVEKHMAIISTEVYVLGVYAILDDKGNYAVSTVPSMQRLTPSLTNTVQINDVPYTEFVFNKGSTVIANTNLVVDDVSAYQIFDEFFSKGKVPWFIDYIDLGNIFKLSKKYAGVSFDNNRDVLELVTSIISRDPNNLYEQYRHSIKSSADLENKPPTYVSLDAIQFTATNTTAKLAGSYMSEGVVSALVNPAKRKERIESLLTK